MQLIGGTTASDKVLILLPRSNHLQEQPSDVCTSLTMDKTPKIKVQEFDDKHHENYTLIQQLQCSSLLVGVHVYMIIVINW